MFPSKRQVARGLNEVCKHFERHSLVEGEDAQASDHFLAKLQMESAGAGPAYTDARYEFIKQLPDLNMARNDEFTTVDDPQDYHTYIGTNLAELTTGSHGLPDGEIVLVFKVTLFVGQPVVVYYFTRLPAIVFVKATAAWTTPSGANSVTATWCSEDGTVIGAVGAVTATIVSDKTNTLPQPNTHIAVDDVLACIPTGANAVRLLPVGVKSDSSTSLGYNNTETASSTAVANCERKTVSVSIQTGEVYNSTGDKKLYSMYRTFTFICGILSDITAETRVTIDTPTAACP